jgi:two-component system, chemotaxis family, CheB/CheR fusion protein
MSATDVGTLFLDTSLRIKRFTPRIADLFNITALDEGRYITDFTNRLDYPNFTDDAKGVLRDLGIVAREVASNGRWYLTRLRPYRTEDDRIEGVVCTFVDVTERMQVEQALKNSESRLRLLLGELSHRVKNTLTVVQSMARQSFREKVPREEALRRFSDRLGALSTAHDLLVASDWSGANLHDLVRRQLTSFLGGRLERIHIEGPEIVLPPDEATRLGLILHELGTNAIKYGSLSVPQGTVKLKWGLRHIKGQEHLEFNWLEHGGPPPKADAKPGFGAFLIEKGLPGAEVKRQLKNAGLECTILFPMPPPETKKD